MKKISLLFIIITSTYNLSLADWGIYSADRSWIGINFNGTSTSYRLYNDGIVTGTGYFNGPFLGSFTSPTQTLAISFWDIKT